MKLDILSPLKREEPFIDLPIRLEIASENEPEAAYLKELMAKLRKHTIRSGIEMGGTVYLEIPLNFELD